ncbi:type II secretion system F family protein [Photobacterium sp. OFAV2-7]|uniref:type II secretion system F family protein n=1 Tax=Photobacterium sp. OFAV2-7 TaxID=2917748 RepID=UPI001EF6D7C3|nr:type II secretion system F family protein [Photobacterium sp. OFAV2-7]MCG7586840.1 type II secretion system F family protein [Photobacterium sp. OFAV2-7]
MSVSLWIAVALLVTGGCMALLFNARAQRRDRVVERLGLVSHHFRLAQHHSLPGLPTFSVSRDVKVLLGKAGFHSPQAASWFVVVKLSVMASSMTAWLAYIDFDLSSIQLAKGLVFAIASGLVVEQWLKWRAHEVSQRIAHAVPDALDLMVVCVESGLTLEAIFGRVGKEMAQVAPELSREWLITEAELRVLDSRLEALENLTQRTGIVEIENIVIALSQAEKYGSPIASTMRLIAADSRQYQYLKLEERVGKIPAKMSMPVVVLIMLPVVVLIVAPTIIALLESLGTL